MKSASFQVTDLSLLFPYLCSGPPEVKGFKNSSIRICEALLGTNVPWVIKLRPVSVCVGKCS